jgi:undecaprenyl-diphosphatase
MDFFEAFIIAIVEGITEFLPISSTGHMIIANKVLGVQESNFSKLYIISIQLGAILSVVVIYYSRFLKTRDFYYKLLLAFLPAAFFGLALSDMIDNALENVLGVAIFLLIGGFVLLFVDKWFQDNSLDKEEDITYFRAFKIGCFQCLALFPGVSRSASTIIGGMCQKLTRKNAAEFSFFLAVPTMFAATCKKLYDFNKLGVQLNQHEICILIFGNIIAFIVAIIAIKFFISMLNKNGFKIFGWYRILLGSVLITLYLLKIPLNIMK